MARGSLLSHPVGGGVVPIRLRSAGLASNQPSMEYDRCGCLDRMPSCVRHVVRNRRLYRTVQGGWSNSPSIASCKSRLAFDERLWDEEAHSNPSPMLLLPQGRRYLGSRPSGLGREAYIDSAGVCWADDRYASTGLDMRVYELH